MKKSNFSKPGTKRSGIQKSYIYEQLLILCPTVMNPPPRYEMWIKTREVADKCNISIYSARIYLLELVQEGKVLCSHQSINNSLRWYPLLQDEVVLAMQKEELTHRKQI